MAKTISYNTELLKATALLLDTFNDITIQRKNKNIKVKCVYGKKSRIYKSLENPKRGALQPPMIAITRTGLERDPTRVVDLNNHILTSMGTDYNNYPPNPITIDYELSVITKYQEDMDKILTNFIPFLNQSMFVISENPKTGGEIKHEIIWDGGISEEDISEIDFETAELNVSTTTLKFKTWIWAGTGIPSTSGLIEKINVQPNLCSIGVQKLLWDNNLSNTQELCAISGLELDDSEYYNDIYSLSHWYVVSPTDTFDQFEEKIKLGYIDPFYSDSLPISGGVSGYVSDLGLGLDTGDQFNLSGDEYYYVDNEGGIVIYASTSALTEPFSATCMLT